LCCATPLAKLGVHFTNHSAIKIFAVSSFGTITWRWGLYVAFTGLKLHSKDFTPTSFISSLRWLRFLYLPVINLNALINPLSIFFRSLALQAFTVRVTKYG